MRCWALMFNKQILKVSLKQPSCLVEKVGHIRKVCRNDSKQIQKVLSVIDKDVYMNISQIISTIKSLAGNVKHEIFIDPVPDKPNTRKVNIVFRDLQTDDDWLLGFKAELRKRCEKEKFPYIILKNSKSNYSDKVYPRIVMTMNMNQGE